MNGSGVLQTVGFPANFAYGTLSWGTTGGNYSGALTMSGVTSNGNISVGSTSFTITVPSCTCYYRIMCSGSYQTQVSSGNIAASVVIYNTTAAANASAVSWATSIPSNQGPWPFSCIAIVKLPPYAPFGYK